MHGLISRPLAGSPCLAELRLSPIVPSSRSSLRAWILYSWLATGATTDIGATANNAEQRSTPTETRMANRSSCARTKIAADGRGLFCSWLFRPTRGDWLGDLALCSGGHSREPRSSRTGRQRAEIPGRKFRPSLGRQVPGGAGILQERRLAGSSAYCRSHSSLRKCGAKTRILRPIASTVTGWQSSFSVKSNDSKNKEMIRKFAGALDAQQKSHGGWGYDKAHRRATPRKRNTPFSATGS